MKTVNIKIAITLDIDENTDKDYIDELLNDFDYEITSEDGIILDTEIIENQCE